MEISVEIESISNNVKNSSSRYRCVHRFSSNRSTVRISMARYFVRSGFVTCSMANNFATSRSDPASSRVTATRNAKL